MSQALNSRKEAMERLTVLTSKDPEIPSFRRTSVKWLNKISKQDFCTFKHREAIFQLTAYMVSKGWV